MNVPQGETGGNTGGVGATAAPPAGCALLGLGRRQAGNTRQDPPPRGAGIRQACPGDWPGHIGASRSAMEAPMVSQSRPDSVSLDGTPAQVGAAFGAVNGPDIRRGVDAYFRAMQDERQRGPDAVRAAGEVYLRLLERHAPHWLTEAAALARAADVDPERYLLYQGAKYRGINRPDCFSWTVGGEHTASGCTLIHKNRDNTARAQCAYLKAVQVRGRRCYRFLANGDTSDLGLMMAVNEKGLAAVADQGHKDPQPRWRGMMNPDILRLIVEQAADVPEALALLQDIQAQGLYAGGDIATYWLFADRHGHGLRVYQFHERMTRTTRRRAVLVMRDQDPRGALVRRAIAAARGSIDAPLMNRLSRQDPVLAASNISCFTAAMPSRHADLFTYAWFAVNNARNTIYVPLYMGVTATPRGLLDGTLSEDSMRPAASPALRDELTAVGLDLEGIEDDLEAERGLIETAARQALAASGRDAARAVLTAGCQRLARRAGALLRLTAARRP